MDEGVLEVQSGFLEMAKIIAESTTLARLEELERDLFNFMMHSEEHGHVQFAQYGFQYIVPEFGEMVAAAFRAGLAAAEKTNKEQARARVEADRLATRVLTMMHPSSHVHHGVPGKLRRSDSMNEGGGPVMMINGAEVGVTHDDGGAQAAFSSKFSKLVSARPPPGHERPDTFEISAKQKAMLDAWRLKSHRHNKGLAGAAGGS
eukprot:CAMPEP_0205921146 /NCGR_PEP_ID=MMETSP1325-20131115/12374_1 /ASSEMBLY_ACC=CAM_ASM_000708 /TAXON_ID=236786 /ORGANISM="Florenciella sp., Strain RCC1007" /LENGTH=203 /DNA_ID=CAMNT_0053288925 /DNA_START=201 /DNA_END=808 /DNA_ORIENTATION=+